jgi:hypothetical protein
LSHRRAPWRQRHHERLAPRKLKNFSRNRPETTNLNHQYAIRCVFIDPSYRSLLMPEWPN